MVSKGCPTAIDVHPYTPPDMKETRGDDCTRKLLVLSCFGADDDGVVGADGDSLSLIFFVKFLCSCETMGLCIRNFQNINKKEIVMIKCFICDFFRHLILLERLPK